jgi:predicted dehydrogenase
MKELGIGLIGIAFMGKAHAIAYRTALSAFSYIPTPRLVAVTDMNADQTTPNDTWR